jgi:CheY-like chemotaxis protein
MANGLEPLILVADRLTEQSIAETKQPPPRVLIVDDEEQVRRIFERLLRDEGYDVRAVATARAALDAVAEWHPDAILLDYRMPLVNGVGFLYRLREHESASGTPVAVITGVDDSKGALSKECATLGVALYFKPIGPAALRNIARTLLASGGDARQSPHAR